MSRTLHTYTANVCLEWDHYTAEGELEIDFWFQPGAPARGPGLNSPGEPPDPDEVEIHEVRWKIDQEETFEPIPQQILEILDITDSNDTLYESLIEYAREDGGGGDEAA